MSILLTSEQIKDIRKLQKNLDERIREEHQISADQDLSLEKYLALKTELFEFVNEIESFKYWKANKGKSNILEEACDTLHFIFSIAIDNDVEIKMSENMLEGYNADSYDMNELLGISDAIISDCYLSRDWDDLNALLEVIVVALDKCGFDADDLYKCYVSKNRVNHDRQDNKY